MMSTTRRIWVNRRKCLMISRKSSKKSEMKLIGKTKNIGKKRMNEKKKLRKLLVDRKPCRESGKLMTRLESWKESTFADSVRRNLKAIRRELATLVPKKNFAQ